MSKACENGDSSATFVPVSALNSAHPLYQRLQELREFYCSEFGSEPRFFVRVPGRVNIIGEHVDYCGYPVLPMAIDQSICLAVGDHKTNSFLQLRNLQANKFEKFKCDLNTISINIPEKGGPEWYKYYLCGVKGIYEALTEGSAQFNPVGMNVALSGNIPPAAGLSSSSALVSAAALATAYVHNLPLHRKQLASISARCERYIGTQGGGMDQAIAYLAKMGCAQFIEFHPELNATPIQLPQGTCFVVANSLAEKNKAASSDFNERVVECRLGARIMGKRMGLANWKQVIRFAELQAALKCNLTELEDLVKECLPKDVYTRDEICQELGVTSKQLETGFLTANTHHMHKFKLRQRALHVVQESIRVQEFRNICEQGVQKNVKEINDYGQGDSSDSHLKRLTNLKQLMRESHHSLQNLYECSHPDLDRIIAISDEVGIGARLTGAGWGGCVVALCDSVETSHKYIQELKEKYFACLPSHILELHKHNDFQDVVFATLPCESAEVFSV